jgi:undecaprenyl diphosphate synthase
MILYRKELGVTGRVPGGEGDRLMMVKADSYGPTPGVQRHGRLPRSTAIIMDGNGRWATRRNLPRTEGHAAGEAAITATVDEAIEIGIEYLTLFAFSTENWQRPPLEVAFLMSFNKYLIEKHGADYDRRGIRVRYLGSSRERIPAPVAEAMSDIERRTSANTNLTLTFAFNHGGRSEIVDAFRLLLERGICAADVDESVVSAHLQYSDIPDPDLIIRTSGEHRLSNFLLWRAAYAELVFLDVLWPDFRGEHLRAAIELFQKRQRRFGAIEDQAAVPHGPTDGVRE